MPLLHLLHVLQRQRARGEVTGVGIVLTTLHQELLEVVIADDSLSADDGMTLIRNLLWDAVNGFCKVGDIRADMSITSCDNLGESSVIIRHDEGQTIQFPRYPDGQSLRPFHQFRSLLGLCQ